MITAQVAHEHARNDVPFVASSIALAVVGSFAALVSAIRIQAAQGAARLRWIIAAAISLGGGAIWSMHFMGMLGYHVDDRILAYNLPVTALSLLIVLVVSAIGLAIVGSNPRSVGRLAVGGVAGGLGAAATHYTGMAAMRTGSTVTYDSKLVGASVAIAVGAATAALWLAFRVRTATHVVTASVVMAGAVCAMHYTAMAATQVAQTDRLILTNGTDPIALSYPVMLIAFSVLAVIIFAALGGFAESGTSPLVAPWGNGQHPPGPAVAGRQRSAPHRGHQPAPDAKPRGAEALVAAGVDRPGHDHVSHPAQDRQDWAGHPARQPAAPALPENDSRTSPYRRY